MAFWASLRLVSLRRFPRVSFGGMDLDLGVQVETYGVRWGERKDEKDAARMIESFAFRFNRQ